MLYFSYVEKLLWPLDIPNDSIHINSINHKNEKRRSSQRRKKIIKNKTSIRNRWNNTSGLKNDCVTVITFRVTKVLTKLLVTVTGNSLSTDALDVNVEHVNTRTVLERDLSKHNDFYCLRCNTTTNGWNRGTESAISTKTLSIRYGPVLVSIRPSLVWTLS